MGPNLPYKSATPNRKTSHTRTSQSRKTSYPNAHLRAVKRATRVHLRTGKRAIRIHLRLGKRATRVQRARLSFPYNNSRSAIWRVLTGTLPPLGSRLRPRVRVRLPGQTRCTERGRYAGRQEDRKTGRTGKTGRQGGQPDTLSRAGSFRPCHPCPIPPTYPARQPCPPTLPRLPPFPRVSYCQQECHTRTPQNGLLSSHFTISQSIKTLRTDTQQLARLLNIMFII